MTSNEHTSKQFDQELESLRARVLQMGGFVEQQVSLAVDALTTGDMELCANIVANDHKVNAMEVGIDEDCSTIIARRQPAAGDLRLVMMVVKTITDLERIGDEAAKIARMAKLINSVDRVQQPRYVEIRRMANLALEMRKGGYEPALVGYTTTTPDPRRTPPRDPRFRTLGSLMRGWHSVGSWEPEKVQYFNWLRAKGFHVPETPEDIWLPLESCVPGATTSASRIPQELSDTAWATACALPYLEGMAHRPWFLHLGYYRPHPPFIAPAPYNTFYDPAEVPAPVRAASPEIEAQQHPLLAHYIQSVKQSQFFRDGQGLGSAMSEAEVRRSGRRCRPGAGRCSGRPPRAIRGRRDACGVFTIPSQPLAIGPPPVHNCAIPRTTPCARIARARAYAPRPYEIVVLSDHGQTQGATFKQRHGYGLDDLVRRSVEGAKVADLSAGDENDATVGHAIGEATGRKQPKKPKNDVSDEHVIVLGSGNLGLIYLMEERRRLTLEEIDERHPRLIAALRAHPHVGWLLVRSAEHGPVALGASGVRYLADDRIDGDDPLASFAPNAGRHLLRTDGFEHVADIMVGSFYDPDLDEGCAFEELISFHGGLGGPQTRAFLLHPAQLAVPDGEIVGAAHVNEILRGWRRQLHGAAA
jgi:hypothetical protein